MQGIFVSVHVDMYLFCKSLFICVKRYIITIFWYYYLMFIILMENSVQNIWLKKDNRIFNKEGNEGINMVWSFTAYFRQKLRSMIVMIIMIMSGYTT